MIYICIPALNEARTVGVLLWRVRQVMDEFRRDYQLLVLDDGSTDETQEVLAPYTQVLPLTVFRNERTQGYAAALERLLREAVQRSSHPKRDVVITLQADFTESPDDIPALLKRVEGGADVVGTAVVGAEGETTRGMRWSRRGLPWLLGRSRLPKEIRDPLSGFRAYRVAVLKRALQDHDGKPLLTRSGWAANAELLLQVAPHARRAEDADVRLRYTRRDRETRFRPWTTALELWGLVRSTPRGPRPAVAAASAPLAEAAEPIVQARPAAPAEAQPSTPAPRPKRPRAQKPRAPAPEPSAPDAQVETAAPSADGEAPAPGRRSGSRRRRGRGGSRRGGGGGGAPQAAPPEGAAEG